MDDIEFHSRIDVLLNQMLKQLNKKGKKPQTNQAISEINKLYQYNHEKLNNVTTSNGR